MSIAHRFVRSFSRCSRTLNSIRTSPQWISHCPEPTCGCQSLPPGLEIDHDSKMTFSPYSEHLVVCTGRNDWASKIELDLQSGPVTGHLKALLGPPGKRRRTDSHGIIPGRYYDPYRPHIVTNASFYSSAPALGPVSPKLTSDEPLSEATSIYLFPSFQYVTLPPAPDAESYNLNLTTLVEDFAGANHLARKGAEEATEDVLERKKQHKSGRAALSPLTVNEVVVLICGHGGRDSRCGALGLPLKEEFERKLGKASFDVLPRQRSSHSNRVSKAAHVGLISHVGGHKWAGNIIIYIPPSWQIDGLHPLSGTAIWYGRVEPKHVEGIVQETILGGRVIRDIWRGGMRLSGSAGTSRWEPMLEGMS